MLTLLPIFILVIACIAMLLLRLIGPRFAYFWLVAAGAALLAWPVVLLAYPQAPETIPLVTWQPQELFPISPSLLLDPVSWAYALALATLLLAVLLTDVARAWEVDWSAWASSLLITALGLLAVLAGNLLTLLLAWALIDLFELFVLMSQVLESDQRERIVATFSARLAGILLVIWAGMVERWAGASLTFPAISEQASLYLLVAAGLRLGVLPLHVAFFRDPAARRGLGTLLRLVPVAASLILLARTAQASLPGWSISPLLVLAALASLYGAAAWTGADDELDGRPFWILGVAGLSVAAAIRGQAIASLAWGVALLLAGGLIFLTSARHPRLLLISTLGLLGLTALPYTPSWQGVGLYAPPFSPLLLIFVFSHALLMAGYMRHATRPGETLAGAERWVMLIYPLGLFLLPLAQFVITWRANGQSGVLPSLVASWPALAAIVVVAGLAALYQRGIYLPARLLNQLGRFFSFGWLYQTLWVLYRSIGRGIAFLNRVLEGDGGILWTLLLLTLLLSLLVQRGMGG